MTASGESGLDSIGQEDLETFVFRTFQSLVSMVLRIRAKYDSVLSLRSAADEECMELVMVLSIQLKSVSGDCSLSLSLFLLYYARNNVMR